MCRGRGGHGWAGVFGILWGVRFACLCLWPTSGNFHQKGGSGQCVRHRWWVQMLLQVCRVRQHSKADSMLTPRPRPGWSLSTSCPCTSSSAPSVASSPPASASAIVWPQACVHAVETVPLPPCTANSLRMHGVGFPREDEHPPFHTASCPGLQKPSTRSESRTRSRRRSCPASAG